MYFRFHRSRDKANKLEVISRTPPLPVLTGRGFGCPSPYPSPPIGGEGSLELDSRERNNNDLHDTNVDLARRALGCNGPAVSRNRATGFPASRCG
jgi:hypothetical protein